MKNPLMAVSAFLLLCACGPQPPAPANTQILPDTQLEDAGCDPSTLNSIESQISSTDGAGHGPDVGSEEWYAVVEFKLGVRGKEDLPMRGTPLWCTTMLVLAEEKLTPDTQSVAPSFDCAAARPGSMEQLVCQHSELAQLDNQLADVYRTATDMATGEVLTTLKAEQRGWIKGRNECWKSDNQAECVQQSYQQRISELQAWYRLSGYSAPQDYQCGESPANVFTVTFFQSMLPTLIAERGDQVALMYLSPSGSGNKYTGRNTEFWEHQGEARIIWGVDATPVVCKKVEKSE